MENLTQKQIKAIKKEVGKYGILERGYYFNIKNIFSYNEIITAIEEIENDYNLKISNLKEFEQDDIIFTQIIKKMNYQAFKNKALQYIFH